jgi:hypothetical protein
LTEATNTPEKYDFSADPHIMERADVTPQDFMLDDTLRTLHGDKSNLDVEFNLTVIVDGAVVSGLAISNKKWADLTSALLNGVFPQLAEEFADSANFLRQANEDMVEQRAAEDRPRVPFKFIHMRDVTIHNGGGLIRFPLWRGKLSHVSGWSFGSTNVPKGADGE